MENSIEDLQKQLEELKKQSEEYLNGWKRAKADLVNLQKQTEKDLEESGLFWRMFCIKRILPVFDSLECAVQHVIASDSAAAEARGNPEDLGDRHVVPTKVVTPRDDTVEGILKIHKQMEEELRNLGAEFKSEGLGDIPNPELHEVIGKEKTDKYKSGTICRIIQKGCSVDGKLLRPAKVIVSE